MNSTEASNGIASPQGREQLSVVIPCRNESRHIARCLDSVVSSDFPKSSLEVLVVDGDSEDGTGRIVEAYSRRYGYIRLLHNPRKRTPAALNIGIAAAKGQIVLRMDAHAAITATYLSQCVDGLRQYNADNVGGIIRTLPQTDGFLARAIVRCLSHRFGVGNSAFRTGLDRPAVVDTVFGGCYRRDVFERVGLFNEGLERSQDIEFNLRLKRAGGKTILLPHIVSEYYARSEYLPFVRHNFVNGMWSVLPFVYSHVVPVSARHLVPLAFVVSLLISLILIAAGIRDGVLLLAVICGSYLVCTFAASISVSRTEKDWKTLLALPFVFFTLHLTYGFGSLVGLFRALIEIARRRFANGPPEEAAA